MKPTDQEVQRRCPQFWKIQLALKCDSHKTTGCPENLRQGGKRGKKKNVVSQYMDIVITVWHMTITKYKQGQPWTYSELIFSLSTCGFCSADWWGNIFRGWGEVYGSLVMCWHYLCYLSTTFKTTLKRHLKTDDTFSPACASWKDSFSLLRVTLLSS